MPGVNGGYKTFDSFVTIFQRWPPPDRWIFFQLIPILVLCLRLTMHPVSMLAECSLRLLCALNSISCISKCKSTFASIFTLHNFARNCQTFRDLKLWIWCIQHKVWLICSNLISSVRSTTLWAFLPMTSLDILGKLGDIFYFFSTVLRCSLPHPIQRSIHSHRSNPLTAYSAIFVSDVLFLLFLLFLSFIPFLLSGRP